MDKITLQNIFVDKLPADKNLENTRRQVKNACYSFVQPQKVENPTCIHFNKRLQEELSLPTQDSFNYLDFLSGNLTLENTKPYAMCYGGHQFGHWAGQLGDGRAINLGQLNSRNKNYTIQLKGVGETPYSRRADGKAVLRSSIREYLCSEAMFYLNIPTTRALSLVLSGEEVLRDKLYDGNSAYEKGAIVSRVSESFLRFGNFEILAAQRDEKTLKTLADFIIDNHFSELNKETTKNKYEQLLKEIIERTLDLVVHWQRVGFIHAVMNTDNMSVLGETIDYGPFGWLNEYDEGFTPNTSDAEERRYRFGNQPFAAQWNLVQLLNAFYPLIKDKETLQNLANSLQKKYQKKYREMMRLKLGLHSFLEIDLDLIDILKKVLYTYKLDYTLFFRELSKIKKTDTSKEAIKKLKKSFYKEYNYTKADSLDNWMEMYLNRLNLEINTDEQRADKMNKINPKYILRNYMYQECILKAEKHDFTLLNSFFTLLENPYDEQPEFEQWYAKIPDSARENFGGSQLSCSS